ncbi:MAG: Hpt domain-containing protein [Anaerolineae bacterium]|nr:Hpt domain-containing protein [Anaerolineae bacterium]
MDTEKYRELYLTEAHKHLMALERAAVALRSTPVDAESLEGGSRAAHTLRGMSAMMGYEQLSRLAGEVETLFGGLEHGISAGNCEIAGILTECLAALRELLGHVVDGETQDLDLTPLLRRMKALV